MSKFLDEIRLSEGKKRGQTTPIQKRELAEMMEVTPATVSNYYSGKEDIPASWYRMAYKRYRWSKKKVADLLLD